MFFFTGLKCCVSSCSATTLLWSTCPCHPISQSAEWAHGEGNTCNAFVLYFVLSPSVLSFPYPISDPPLLLCLHYSWIWHYIAFLYPVAIHWPRYWLPLPWEDLINTISLGLSCPWLAKWKHHCWAPVLETRTCPGVRRPDQFVEFTTWGPVVEQPPPRWLFHCSMQMNQDIKTSLLWVSRQCPKPPRSRQTANVDCEDFRAREQFSVLWVQPRCVDPEDVLSSLAWPPPVFKILLPLHSIWCASCLSIWLRKWLMFPLVLLIWSVLFPPAVYQ